MIQQSVCLSGRCKSRYCHQRLQEIYYTLLHTMKKTAFFNIESSKNVLKYCFEDILDNYTNGDILYLVEAVDNLSHHKGHNGFGLSGCLLHLLVRDVNENALAA